MKNKKAIYGGLMFVSVAALAAGVYFLTKKKGVVMQSTATVINETDDPDTKTDETVIENPIDPVLNPVDPLPVKPIIEVPVRDFTEIHIFDEQPIHPIDPIPIKPIIEVPIFDEQPIIPINPLPSFIELHKEPVTVNQDLGYTTFQPITFDLSIKSFV